MEIKLFLLIGITFVIYLLGFGGSSFLTNYILKKTDQDIAARYFRYSKYIRWGIMILMILLMVTLIAFDPIEILSYWTDNEILQVILMVVFILVSMLGLLILISLPGYRIERELRGATTPKGRYLWLVTAGILFIFGGIIVTGLIGFILFLAVEKLPLWIGIPIFILLFLLFVLLFYTHYPRLLGIIYGSTTIQDNDIRSRLVRLTGRVKVKIKDISLIRTRDLKMANAWVFGLLSKRIYITDYLLDNFSLDETETVLAHELGHVKKKDLWIYFVSALGYGPFFGIIMLGLSPVLDFEKMSAGFWGLTGLILAPLYFVVLFGIISRKLEFRADRYVIEVASNPSAYIEALKKLAALNTMPFRWKKKDEALLSHPSLERRILKFSRVLNSRKNDI
jgi:STE24 endopeptidase